MHVTLLAVLLAVPTAFGFRVFLALAMGQPGIAGRPVMATLGTIALLVPALGFHSLGVTFGCAVIALAALITFAARVLTRSGANAAT
jgi:hypothetical protein